MDYGLKRKPITTRNFHSNTIIERIHQTIGNIIRTFDVSNIVNNDPCPGILAATMFAARATYHTALQASSMQLVFGQDAILKIKHVADWEHIRQCKKLWINHNNMRENMRRNNHQYKVGDYSGACFRAFYCDWFAIICVVGCVPRRQHAWCLRWHLVQILAAS